MVIPYIKKTAAQKDESCADALTQYLHDLDMFNNSHGSAITTHKKYLYMNGDQLRKYDTAIIDEDIILKAVIPDQCIVPLAKLERVLNKGTPDSMLAKK